MTVQDEITRAVSELAGSSHAIALTGAGISTESGIPDYRGPKGVWTLDKQAEAKAYERYEMFLGNPRHYWEEMLSGQGAHGAFYAALRYAQPNPGHRALAELERVGVLKHVITQNIDGLHRRAGSRNVVEYHGSVDRIRCPACGSRRGFESVTPGNLPPYCTCGGVMKYDVVHFKEPIPFDVMEEAEHQARVCDIMLICGTSAVVYPFAALPRTAKLGGKSTISIIEVNAEPTPLTLEGVTDYFIQGKTGEILPEIAAAVRKIKAGE
ncbi:MAG: NAD-dependent deacylase [Dehalococcoidia bacterium]|nr:NAD-dependent deacylase [Dehalococcoidia bacterium]